jgi:hypothetical protein
MHSTSTVFLFDVDKRRFKENAVDIASVAYALVVPNGYLPFLFRGWRH